jgi:myo-inositol 2-dehydrogenase / D-chiro-inositol 1-dehydrogenase
MPQKGLHLGLVGVGRIGRFHAQTLSTLPDVSRLTIADLDADHAAAVAAEVGAGVMESPEEIVGAGVDALVIATSTPGHVPMLELAAEAGVAAFCEKPVALELEVLDRVVEDVERSGVLVQIGFQRRFDAGYRAARDAVAAGRLGTLLVLRAATHDPVPPADDYIAASGGIFRDLHIHDFDAIRFVTGQEVAEVYADGAVRETPWFEDHGDVDAAAAVLRLADGALAVLTGTRHDALGYDVRLEVFGSRDSVAVGVDDRTPLHSLEPDAENAPAHAYRDFVERFQAAYRRELQEFVTVVRDGGPSPCTLADARAALAVAVAAGRSRAEHRPVAIEEVTSAETVAG